MFSRKHRDQKLIDHFIYADGISIQFFKDNHSRYLGKGIKWRFCTHMSNGREGFLCKVYEPIQPEVIKRMRKDAGGSTGQRSEDQVSRVHFEELNDSWEQHLVQQPWLDGQSNLNIPTLQLPQTQGYSDGNPDFYWDEGNQSWIRSPNYNSNSKTQFTRSTPTSPVSSRDSFWCKSPESGSGRPSSSVSQISSNGDYLDPIDQYQQRPLSSSNGDYLDPVNQRRPRALSSSNGDYLDPVNQHQRRPRALSSGTIDHDWLEGSKKPSSRPRSAIALGQSKTAHKLHISGGSFGAYMRGYINTKK